MSASLNHPMIRPSAIPRRAAMVHLPFKLLIQPNGGSTSSLRLAAYSRTFVRSSALYDRALFPPRSRFGIGILPACSHFAMVFLVTPASFAIWPIVYLFSICGDLRDPRDHQA